MAFPKITKDTQKAFERDCQGALIQTPDTTPEICGYYGRACRQMEAEEGANRMICSGCPLAAYALSRSSEFTSVLAELNDSVSNSNSPSFFTWMHYMYEDNGWPLVFVPLKLTSEQIVQLLKWFDNQYGDTCIETNEWALEYQLLTRMLVHESALLANPWYLDIDDNMRNEIAHLIGPDAMEKYRPYCGMSAKEARDIHNIWGDFC